MESMESSTVAMLVKYFNTASIIVVAFFAIYGAVMIIRRKVFRVNKVDGRAAKRQKNAAKGGNALLSAFCVAALAAFAVEAVFFNYQHYLKIFAGPEIQTLGVSPENPGVLLTTQGGTVAEIVSNGVAFKDLNMKVTSLFVEAGFGNAEVCEMTVHWTDDAGTYGFKKKLLKRLPHDNYVSLQSCGKVHKLDVVFSMAENGAVEVAYIALNRQIPLYFSGLRLIVVSLLLFALFCFLKKEPHDRAAYYLFEYKFNPANLKQNLVHALIVIALIIFSYICVNTSYSKEYLEYPVHQQYNRFLVDALLEGRTWLNYGTPENLLKAERPYDNAYRLANGYKFDTDVMWDWTWYKGKFYCYYGVVPAVILYLPYKIITGEYLSNNGGIFLFTAVIIILMAMIWRFCAKKYMPNAGFVFYTLSFLTLFFASGIFVQLRFNRLYSIHQTAGLMFALAGCLLLLKSVENEKINRLKLFFACLCLALVVGCRPNMIFVSLLVPVVLWKYRSWKLLLFVALPYMIVAIPLCAYNYVRFDSIFEFGVKYTMSGVNNSAVYRLNPLGKIIKTFDALVSCLFNPNKYTLRFPFVETLVEEEVVMPGGLGLGICGSGIVNFPIVFCLLYLFKNILKEKPVTQPILWAFVITATVIATVNSYVMGFWVRFTLDFAVFFILPSLFCAYYWCAGVGGTLPNKNRLSVVYVLLAVSVFVGSFLCVTGTFITGVATQVPCDPVLYRYLEYSLGILRSV